MPTNPSFPVDVLENNFGLATERSNPGGWGKGVTMKRVTVGEKRATPGYFRRGRRFTKCQRKKKKKIQYPVGVGHTPTHTAYSGAHVCGMPSANNMARRLFARRRRVYPHSGALAVGVPAQNVYSYRTPHRRSKKNGKNTICQTTYFNRSVEILKIYVSRSIVFIKVTYLNEPI